MERFSWIFLLKNTKKKQYVFSILKEINYEKRVNDLYDSIVWFNDEIFYLILNNGCSIKDQTFWDYHRLSNLIEYTIKTFNVPLSKYLYEECSLFDDFEKYERKELFELASNLNQLELVKYFIDIFAENSTEEKDNYRIKLADRARRNGCRSIVEYLNKNKKLYEF